ncbi:hypothetical protein FDP41_000064 [Naegleria fowleri]|uniref:RING-type domain-containing protein n=1 Tax=Naegleria fowleri TaxID=5763 RepID=A0A6A5CI83_NAEFO|nr:uncharacterized protein FDP41_000064 [Naegleria fowleri]KAF0985025.1 hypothetical protein FDP41_000064 [Naegleria fowleri]CAG4713178.1 unnamed protein product [Naegleria fowleri]
MTENNHNREHALPSSSVNSQQQHESEPFSTTQSTTNNTIHHDEEDDDWEDVHDDEEDDDTLLELDEDHHPLCNSDNNHTSEVEVEAKQYSSDLGCSHYPHNCQIESPCCKEFFWCRVCHDNEAFQKCKCKVENMDRYSVKRVKCMRCGTIQSSDNVECENSECKTRFGEFYTCTICHIYSNDPKRPIYHCDGCKICRLGKREQFLHCYTCGACMAPNHKCIPQCMQSHCPICMEDLFSSRESVHLLKCGHPMHWKCFRNALKSRIYNCPLCQKYMVEISEESTRIIDEEIANTPLPKELQDKKVKILCNECLQRNDEAPFHIFGIKCPNCGSYNTKQIV